MYQNYDAMTSYSSSVKNVRLVFGRRFPLQLGGMLVKIKVKSTEIKRKILKNSFKLNEGSDITDPNKKLYINADYTKKERETHKALRTELNNMSAEDRQKYVIRNSRLVLKDRPDGSEGRV